MQLTSARGAQRNTTDDILVAQLLADQGMGQCGHLLDRIKVPDVVAAHIVDHQEAVAFLAPPLNLLATHPPVARRRDRMLTLLAPRLRSRGARRRPCAPDPPSDSLPASPNSCPLGRYRTAHGRSAGRWTIKGDDSYPTVGPETGFGAKITGHLGDLELWAGGDVKLTGAAGDSPAATDYELGVRLKLTKSGRHDRRSTRCRPRRLLRIDRLPRVTTERAL